MSIGVNTAPGLEDFGLKCFNERKMKESVPQSVFRHFKQVQQGEKKLELAAADVIATALKNWAIGQGATHFSHWFQPLTGLTAEKHEAFLVPQSDGALLTRFSGKELILSEPDASSFPSGGLRSTFEARGYTAWDTSSPAFIKKSGSQLILMIPTAFVSYTGEALDKKTPLLRSAEALKKQGKRLLHLLGDTECNNVFPTVGAEQEYFLVDRELYSKRSDLLLSGRTVIGLMAAKGQELEDHYFGAIKDRVSSFMDVLNLELWRLGINARTQHNEVAPSQFELALVFSHANCASDQNQLVMETMKRVADREGLACLLHEKPFDGINGSGKHNNWSLATDTGLNLFDPGNTESERTRFLLMVAALLKGVDKHAAWLRSTAASSGNDHRLGANEAPPAIISVYLAEEIQQDFERFCAGKSWSESNGNHRHHGSVLAPFSAHTTDRNRTSPLAFTGNKFEFRMAGSSQAIADSTTVLNTLMADAMSSFADQLEQSTNVEKTTQVLIKDSYQKHNRVVFNGNNYSQEWKVEAEKRGLPNLINTIEASEALLSDSTVETSERLGIFTKAELESRKIIALETYAKQIKIEATVMLEMVERAIYPACCRSFRRLAETMEEGQKLGFAYQGHLSRLRAQSQLHEQLLEAISDLREKLDALSDKEDDEAAHDLCYVVIPAMKSLRAVVDQLHNYCAADLWPYPTYEELLFSL